MKLTFDWIDWIKTNIDAGCLPEDLINKMIQNGFSFDLACAVVTHIAQDKQSLTKQDASKILEKFSLNTKTTSTEQILPKEISNQIHIQQQQIKVAMKLDDPKVVLFHDVLTAQECDEIILLSQEKMQRSRVVDPHTGQHVLNPNRTSEGTYFKVCENELFTRVDHRLAELMNVPLEHGEGCQILKYGIGGEYRPHFDYFDPNKKGTAETLARSGQRISTLIMYLNDVEEGGATYFPELGIHVMPVKGSAVYFEYYNTETKTLDPRSLHAGMPVVKGEKWIMTKWVRDQQYST
ncbi:2OG-Fe(II) oxygenase [Acinetobacter boissieri]|uniref:Prolyl 4-hydroxylase n=1 Tax=Acinetobacter boissieri TaxID=1219383 RepID=A0A1G6HFT7_9GAMM|nr:2OG-Fe(II) oxygenase [Acinetobacter boissieri]SDB92978.1 prolyl 4-hydroxylase [Acinetobacter boissieri]